MNNLIDRFLNQLTAEEKSPETLSHYREELTRFSEWLNDHHSLTLNEEGAPRITAVMLSEYYQELYARGLRVPTRNNYVVILHRFFDYLTKLRVVPEDASRVLHCVKDKRQRQKLAKGQEKVYTAEQIAALLNSLENGSDRLTDYCDLAIVALILGSGMRASEVCSLNVSAVLFVTLSEKDLHLRQRFIIAVQFRVENGSRVYIEFPNQWKYHFPNGVSDSVLDVHNGSYLHANHFRNIVLRVSELLSHLTNNAS